MIPTLILCLVLNLTMATRCLGGVLARRRLLVFASLDAIRVRLASCGSRVHKQVLGHVIHIQLFFTLYLARNYYSQIERLELT